MSEKTHFRVVIAGGGVGGLTLANALEVWPRCPLKSWKKFADNVLESWDRLRSSRAPRHLCSPSRGINRYLAQRLSCEFRSQPPNNFLPCRCLELTRVNEILDQLGLLDQLFKWTVRKQQKSSF